MVRNYELRDIADFYIMCELRLKKPEILKKLSTSQHEEIEKNLEKIWEIYMQLLANKHDHVLIQKARDFIKETQKIFYEAEV